MSSHDEGYRHGLADAEKVCLMMSIQLMRGAETTSGEALRVAKITADALTLAAKSIRALEPGFVSPHPGSNQ